MFHRSLATALAGALLALACGPALAEQPIPASAKPLPDPAVQRGTLPNGLRYALLRNDTPAGGVSIRLGIDVGSYQEADDERGAAHFIEHMAFRSPRSFAEGRLELAFAPHGIAWGRDQNAVTGIDRTIYWIDLPQRGKSEIPTTLKWLRDVADGIGFAPAAVELERGVVQSEKRLRSSPLTDAHEEISRFQAPHLRSPRRSPIGTDATLRALTPRQLQAFYDRWYRPENAVLVVAGDIDVDDMEARLKAAFGDWKGRGTPGVRAAAPPPSPLPPRATDAFTRSHPSFPNAVSACRTGAADPAGADHFRRVRREAYDLLWQSILNQRLSRLASGGTASLLHASMMLNAAMPDGKTACLVALPTGEKWEPALAAAQAELRRFAAEGPTEAEVDAAIETLRSRLRGGVAQAASRTSPSLAEAIVEAELSKRVFASPRAAMRDYDIAVDGVTPADVKAAFAQDWSGQGPVLVALAPAAPEPARLIAAWTANERAPALAAYADQTTARWAYTSFGEKGRVVRREPVDRYGFVRLHFANGTILNLKKTDFQVEGVQVVISFGQGRREIATKDYGAAIVGAEMFPEGGLGKLSFAEIETILANNSWQFTLGVNTDAFALRATTLASALPLEMSLLAAYMSDPGFRPDVDARLPTAVDLVYRAKATDPTATALEALERSLFPNAATLPSQQEMAGYRSGDFARLLKPALTSSPVEIAIVGAVDETAAIEAVAQTFGALPQRRPAPRTAEVVFKRFPATVPGPVVVRHQGPADKAAAVLAWPLYVASPQRRKEEYALGVLSFMLDAALRQRLRVSMGKTYAPMVQNEMPDDADQGMITAAIETRPEDLEAVIRATRESAAALAAGKFGQEDIESARQPLLARQAEALRSNALWAEVLAPSSRDEQGLIDITEFDAIVSSLTLDDVKQAAARWLKGEPAIAKSLPPGSGAAAGGMAR